jgi:hypothetical protein
LHLHCQFIGIMFVYDREMTIERRPT